MVVKADETAGATNITQILLEVEHEDDLLSPISLPRP